VQVGLELQWVGQKAVHNSTKDYTGQYKQQQAAAAVHAACLPFPSTVPQTHWTVSFFPDLCSALCMHAGVKHGHH